MVTIPVARLMTGHRIARDFESLGEEWYHSNASPYATQRRKQKDETDRQNAEIGSETWKNRWGNLVGIIIEVRLAQKTFKSRWETWEDSELYAIANGNEFGKISK